MRRLFIPVVLSACAASSNTSTTTTATARDAQAAPQVSAACMAARDVRAKAVDLDARGHVILALAKIEEANAACPEERASSAALESSARATLAPADASKGTETTARAKMREAWTAERAKDAPRAKSLYLEAWAELHPNPRALEDAARMASDPAESRRLRDRALYEARGAEDVAPVVTERARAARGNARLIGATLLLAAEGKVLAYDTTTGDVRVRVDATATDTKISPWGTLALSGVKSWAPGKLTVHDVLTGAQLFEIKSVRSHAVAPDDSAIAVIDDKDSPDGQMFARVFDVATGQVRAKLSGKWHSNFIAFSDPKHVIVWGDDTDNVFREFDLDKNAYTSVRLSSQFGTAATSDDGRYFAYLDANSDAGVIHVRDTTTGKDAAQLTGAFHSVEAIAVSLDAKTVATGSFNSLRLWDTMTKKQLFKHETAHNLGTDTRNTDAFSFSDDGKTMLLSGGGPTVAWDVATGQEKDLVPTQPQKSVLRVSHAPSGSLHAVMLEDEVRIVPESGDPKSICKAMKPLYAPLIGPTAVAWSASSMSFACGMSDGWVHLFDTATWTERAVIKRGAESPVDRPVDLVLSADDATLTIVSNTGFVVYDAKTAAEEKRVAFKATMPLAPRHVRFDDGTVGVRTWTGSLAVFGADGAFQREVKLGINAPIAAVDAFSTDGKTYAVAIGKTMHVIDLATAEDHPVALGSAAKRISFTGGVPSASSDAWKDTIDNGKITLEIDPDGIVARDATGAYEVRGKPLVACAVGKTWLSTETCADLAKEGLVATFFK